jgi:hypothetical protein
MSVYATVLDTTKQPLGFIYAAGSGWKAYHASRGLAQVNLVSGGVDRVRSLLFDRHQLHGTLMIATWMAVIPSASLVARLGKSITVGSRVLPGLIPTPHWYILDPESSTLQILGDP